MKIAVGQTNPTIGDIRGNTDKIIEYIKKCENKNVDILVTPEMSLIGYPPMDILRRDRLYKKQTDNIERIKNKTRNLDMYVFVGYCKRTDNGLYNSAMVIHNGSIVYNYDKILLPNYDVFDGHRYFETGEEPGVMNIKDLKIGITICEDAWSDTDIMDIKRHDYNPIDDLSDKNLDFMINLSASPYRVGKLDKRIELFKKHSKSTGAMCVFCNQVGANDELVFDGHSFITQPDGSVNVMDGYNERLKIFDNGTQIESDFDGQNQTENMTEAIKLGISDYFSKTGFSKAIVGMSGGIDSTVATLLTAKALGSENVIGMSLPSNVTSQSSIEDARTVAETLGIEFNVIDIQNSVDTMIDSYSQGMDEEVSGIALENIQARVRGDILMTTANMRDALVITPDNKSEGAVGYCTLYGDTVGAIAPLGDCYKKYVYDIARYYNKNSNSNIIPNRIIEKEPTAELKEDQSDSDEIPEYAELDKVIHEYVEKRNDPNDIDIRNDVDDIISRIHSAEFKRNQSPLPIRVTPKDFGRGWRYPIVADYDFLR